MRDAVAPFRGKLCRGIGNDRFADVVAGSRNRDPKLEIEDLRTFLEVADAGGVSPAARRLGVAKSIVSRRLGRLEEELGIQLLARTTRGAALTEAGATFREYAAKACAEIDAARELYGKLVASPGYVKVHGAPGTPEDLAAHEALMQGTETWQFMDGNEVVTVHPRGRFKADNGGALIAAAVAGLGIACLPDGLTNEHVASGALVPVMTRYPPPPAGIYVIRPPGQHPPLKVWVLTEPMIECFEKAPQLASVGR